LLSATLDHLVVQANPALLERHALLGQTGFAQDHVVAEDGLRGVADLADCERLHDARKTDVEMLIRVGLGVVGVIRATVGGDSG